MTCAVLVTKLKPLEALLKSPSLIELSVVRSGEVILEIADQGFEYREVPELTTKYWESLCYTLGNLKGEAFNPETQPRMSTRLPGGHRFEAMIGKSVESGLSVSIRLNRQIAVSLVDFGLPENIQSELIEAVEEGQSMIISGGTSSGKTTFLKAVIQYIPLEKRILTVEDTRELELPHVNKVQYVVSRNEKDPTIDWPQVIDHLMRSRPDIIIAGELSIANTFSLISLLDTGHKGFMTTVHSNSCQLALEETIPTKVHLSGRNIPSISNYLKKTVDWVIQIQKVQEGSNFRRKVVEVWQPQKEKFQVFHQPRLYPVSSFNNYERKIS